MNLCKLYCFLFGSSLLTAMDNQSVYGVKRERMTFMDFANFVSDIKCNNSGKQQLLQHAKKDKHKQAIKYLQDDKQFKLQLFSSLSLTSSTPENSSSSSTSKLEMIKYSDASFEAQIFWMAKM